MIIQIFLMDVILLLHLGGMVIILTPDDKWDGMDVVFN